MPECKADANPYIFGRKMFKCLIRHAVVVQGALMSLFKV